MTPRSDMVGRVFGKLTVVAFSHYHRQPSGKLVSLWACRCICGGDKITTGQNLLRGDTVSCGCASANQVIHGLKGTPTYNSWKSMKTRCLNQRSNNWQRYGGRGIVICERWLSFPNFLADMGERPEGTSLDRIDNNGPYEPGNCRWATREEQANNTSQNIFADWGGQRKTATQLARMLGLNNKRVSKHVKRRFEVDPWTFCAGVSTPPRLLEHNGRRQSLKAWARELGVTPKTLRRRLERWPLAEALGRSAIRRAS